MLLVYSKATETSDMWFVTIVYYDCIIIINILITNDATKVLFIVTSELSRVTAIYLSGITSLFIY